MHNMKNKLIKISLMSLMLFALISCGNKDNSTSVELGDNWIWWDDEYNSGTNGGNSQPGDNSNDWSKNYFSYIDSLDESDGHWFDPKNGTCRYEAETMAELTGEARVLYDGGSYIGYLQNGATATFRINSAKDCKVLLVGNLSTNPERTDGVLFDEQYSVKVNDVEIDSSDCLIKATNDWSKFELNAIGEINLKQGENIIMFTCFAGLSNIDYISLAPQISDVIIPEINYYSGVIMEAEECLVLNSKKEPNASRSNGYSIGYNSASTKVEFIVNCTNNVNVNFIVNTLLNVSEERSSSLRERFKLTINDQLITLNNTTLARSSDGNWWEKEYYDITLANVSLKQGKNSILLNLSDEVNLDYIKLS